MQPAASPLKSKVRQKLSERIRSALLVEREPSGSERNTSQATCFCARNIPSSVPRKSPCGSIPQMRNRSEEHTSELQSPCNLVCRLLLEKKKQRNVQTYLTQSPTQYTRVHTQLSTARTPTLTRQT